MSTIVAIASAPGAAPRAVLRLSGPDARAILERCLWPDADPVRLDERGLARVRLDDGGGGQPALLLWMPGPRSFTREDVAELHLVGNPHLVEAALARLVALGARPAEPGEFTRRAFLNGRLDLTRAEGVAELVAARTRADRRAATALLFGGLEERVAVLRDALTTARTWCEASLDFDETDTGHIPEADLDAHLAELEARLDEATRWEERRRTETGTPRIVLSGAPNAGKSTLFNRLVHDEARALVADVAGTTRDALVGRWTVRGLECRLVDSAGLSEIEGFDARAEVEREAQRRAREAREGADLVLWLAARDDPHALASLERDGRAPVLIVSTKWDGDARSPGGEGDDPTAREATGRASIGRESTGRQSTGRESTGRQSTGRETAVHESIAHESMWPFPSALEPVAGAAPPLRISALDGSGLDALEEAVARALGLGSTSAQAEAAGRAREISARHKAALVAAHEAVHGARASLTSGLPLDLVAEELRAAGEELDRISGRTTPEDLLDRIFASFCLGK